jgi:dethiobiotin synthetase
LAKGFFITGTDTGVGKTIVTAALIKLIRHLGFSVCGMKPIETGCTGDKSANLGQEAEDKNSRLIPHDGMFLNKIAGGNDSIDLVAPVRFRHPLAPYPASVIEGRDVDLKKIFTAYTALSARHDMVIVEGIGGLLVPILRDYFVFDLAKDFGLPVIVSAHPGLGTINHTLLTVNHALREGIGVAGVIINYHKPPEGTIAEDTNPGVLKEICPVPVIGMLPYLEDLSDIAIQTAALRNINMEAIGKYL